MKQFTKGYTIDRWWSKDLNQSSAAHKNPYTTLNSHADMKGLGKLLPLCYVPLEKEASVNHSCMCSHVQQMHIRYLLWARCSWGTGDLMTNKQVSSLFFWNLQSGWETGGNPGSRLPTKLWREVH